MCPSPAQPLVSCLRQLERPQESWPGAMARWPQTCTRSIPPSPQAAHKALPSAPVLCLLPPLPPAAPPPRQLDASPHWCPGGSSPQDLAQGSLPHRQSAPRSPGREVKWDGRHLPSVTTRLSITEREGPRPFRQPGTPRRWGHGPPEGLAGGRLTHVWSSQPIQAGTSSGQAAVLLGSQGVL